MSKECTAVTKYEGRRNSVRNCVGMTVLATGIGVADYLVLGNAAFLGLPVLAAGLTVWALWRFHTSQSL